MNQEDGHTEQFESPDHLQQKPTRELIKAADFWALLPVSLWTVLVPWNVH